MDESGYAKRDGFKTIVFKSYDGRCLVEESRVSIQVDFSRKAQRILYITAKEAVIAR